MILKCDVCGGKLQMDAGGKTATCEYCGMTHSLERVREKVQEIKGTVHIEGSVNARQTGTGEDVEQWRTLLKKYMAAFDYENAAKIVSKILEALPSDNEAGGIYEQLQEAKYFDIKNGVLNKYNGKAKKVVIPDGVREIGGKAFIIESNGRIESCVTEITIPDSVTSIGDDAFWYCSSLTSISIPSNVTYIGSNAFAGCGNLATVYWNATKCTSAGFKDNLIFQNCPNLKSIVIGDNVITIPEYAFSHCRRLTSITIPESVTSIGDRAFFHCTSLKSVHINDIAKWCAISFGDHDANPLHYAHNLYLNDTLLTNLEIPEGVTSIGDYAFRGCSSLTSITIPSSVTSIGKEAFSHCRRLTSITIPESVTSIGDLAFSDCCNLTSITIPDSVTSIGYRALWGCENLQHFRLPAGDNSYLPPKIRDEIQKKNDLIQREKWKTAGLCQYCGGEFKGFLKKTCSRCGTQKNYHS